MDERLTEDDSVAQTITDIVTAASAVVMQWQLTELGSVSQISDNISQFGYTSSDFLSHRLSVSSILHPRDSSRVFQELERSINNDHQYVTQAFRLVDIEGHIRWISCWTIIDRASDGQSYSLKSLFSDFTEHKLAERRFNIQEADYKRIIANAGANYFFYIHNAEGIFTYVSPTIKEMLGYSEDEFLTHYDEFLTDHPLNELVDYYTEQALQGNKQAPYQIEIHHKDSSHHRLEVSEVPVYDSQGKVFSVVGFAHDVTELIQQQTLLEENQDYLNSILNGLTDGVIILDSQHNILSLNRAAEQLFGYSSKDAVGLPVSNFIQQIDANEEHQPSTTKTSDFIPVEQLLTHSNYPLEATAHHKDKTVTPLRINVTALPGQENQYILSCTDISLEKSQEQQLRRTQKMDALGKMTGGICHDFNNLLGIISGYVSILESRGNLDQQSLGYLSKINTASERGTRLSHKLLSFSSSKISENEKTSINELLLQEQPMLARALTPIIHIEMNLTPQIWGIRINKEDLADSILNIFINAGHAMPTGGTLYVSTQNSTIDERQAASLEIHPGDYVCLRIKDSGTGMDSKTLSEIFDPFFTTKEKGTGLGLSQVYNFVKRSKGGITAVSEQNIGSEFFLYFPRDLSDLTDIEKPSVEANPVIATAGRHILIVDDEPDLMDIAAEFLSQHNHFVYKAKSGSEALALLSQHPIELIISDIMMPEMDGWTLVREARKQNPDLKIQLISGYESGTQSDLVDKDEDLLATLLYKPVSRKTLLERVDRLFMEKNSS
ncbi:MAG: PAS domain S-box protein [Pseudomonadales bacterium]|nr:PAS domain S-box protein [Pseudomonadales bacterium]